MTKKPRTEPELLRLARDAVAMCNWTLGECAEEWTERWAKGRTDADFAKMLGEELGLTASKIGNCRRVWRDFGMNRGQFPHLSWSHFRMARQFPLPRIHEALEWANDNEANVSEMVAWVRGIDGPEAVAPLEDEEPKRTKREPEPDREADPADTTESDQNTASDPAPPVFSKHAVTPPARDEAERPSRADEPTAAQINAAISQLEKVVQVVRSHWPRFKQPQRDRVHSAIAALEQNTR